MLALLGLCHSYVLTVVAFVPHKGYCHRQAPFCTSGTIGAPVWTVKQILRDLKLGTVYELGPRSASGNTAQTTAELEHTKQSGVCAGTLSPLRPSLNFKPWFRRNANLERRSELRDRSAARLTCTRSMSY